MSARQRGFTLIEMVVAMTVAGIVVGFMALFLVAPVQAYFAQERRTELVDSANTAKRMLENDVRNALPESVRLASGGGSVALELLYAADVARYRPDGSSGDPTQDLTLGAADSQFSTLGRFTRLAPGTASGAYLVIGHPTGGNAYSLSGVITPPGTTITVGAPSAAGEQAVVLGAGMAFPATGSPNANVFYVTGPVSYVCDPGAGTIKRFWGYGIAASQPATEAALLAAGASSALVARDVTACDFRYTPGTPQYGGLVRLQMTFTRNGETLQVFDQVQVENLP